MAGLYQLTLCTPEGTALARLPAFTLLDYALVTNDFATATLQYAASQIDPALFAVPDARLYVERAAAPGLPYALEGNTCWFLRRLRQFDGADGVEVLEAEFRSANYVLDSRDVAYNVGNSYTLKLDETDDMMKAVVRENLGSLATDTDRDLSDVLTVAANNSGGPVLRREFARQNVLKVLQDLSDAAAEAGTWVGFNVVVLDPVSGLLQFQTFIGQIGTDRSLGADQLVVGKPFANLVNTALERDHTQERSYVYALGQGVADIRAVQPAEDAARVAASPFNRREATINAGNTFDADALESEAESALRAARPRVVFSGDIVETPSTTYGADYQWGDLVQGVGYGQSFACRVETVRVHVEGGEEAVTAQVRSAP